MATPLCPRPEQRSMNKSSNDPEEDVFLCHSDSEKDFVHQLHVDLRRHNISSFFDKDYQSFPEDTQFVSHIKNCRVAVLVFSPNFFNGESKRPMAEFAKIVQAQKQGNLHILPLFYRISIERLYNELEKGELKNKWEETYREEWSNALRSIRSVNAINRSDYITDVDYREGIVSKIVELLPPNLCFDDSHVQGKERLCLEIDQMLKKVEERNGVKVLGLHGIAGCGKTTICKCLCNFYEGEFEGKVFHLEFSGGTSVQTHNRLLQVVARIDKKALDLASNKDQGWAILKKRMKKHRVFLALDSVDDEEIIEDVKSYLELGYREGSMIVVTSPQADIFKSGRLRQVEIPSENVPHLEEDEAVDILLKGTLVDRKEFSFEQKQKFRNFAQKCFFSDAYNPSALKKMGEDFCGMFGSDPTKWEEVPNLVDLHSVPDKLHSYCYLMASYLTIGKNKPALYLGLNILFARIFLNEFFDIHCIIAKAFLIQLLNGTERKGLIPFLMELLSTDQCKQLLNAESKGLTSLVREVLKTDIKELLNGNEIKNVFGLVKQVLLGN